MSKEKRFEVFYNDESGKWVIKDNEQLPNLLDNYKTCIRLNEFNDKVTDLEAKLDEKKKEIEILTKQNKALVEEEDLLDKKLKELGVDCIEDLGKSQNQKAIEQLEKVKENIHYLLSFDYNLLCKVNEQVDNQIKQLKEKK